ncbi:MAG: hypothetical protein JO148_15235 [Acidimicrobiia bacterium]|nr:hypothetical protein [Acidimicrobiia bacterium]
MSLGGTTVTASTFPAEGESAAPYVEEEDLAKGLAGLRRRAGMLPTDKWLAIAGGVLMPLGVILVFIGWYGAAHTTRLFEEIPYLISGGLLGIVLSTIGAALYFGYWLTRIVAGERQTIEVLARIEAKLDSAPAGSGVASAPRTGAAASTPAGTFVATRTGSMFHRADCPVVADRPKSELRTVKLPATSMSPCKLCAPLD